MVDSSVVLAGQTAAYTFYVLVMMAVMAWFAHRVTRQGEREGIRPVIFYSFVGFLVVCGVSLHIITYKTIPWAPLDLNRAEIRADREFTITVERHQFTLYAEKPTSCHESCSTWCPRSDLFRSSARTTRWSSRSGPSRRQRPPVQFDRSGVTDPVTEYRTGWHQDDRARRGRGDLGTSVS
jgi:hypothetical protein